MDLFKKDDAIACLKGKSILFVGDSILRSIYQDVLCLLNTGRNTDEKDLKRKGVQIPRFMGDILQEKTGLLTTGRNYSEIRNFVDEENDIKICFFFASRCFSNPIKDFLKSLQEKKPDIFIVLSAVWDISRWGSSGPADYEHNCIKLLDYVRYNFEDSQLIWLLCPPVSPQISGPIKVESMTLDREIRFLIAEGNKVVAHKVIAHGFDVLDLHHHLLPQIHKRMADGMHWTSPAVRYQTNLLLTHICLSHDLDLPGRWSGLQNTPLDYALKIANEADTGRPVPISLKEKKTTILSLSESTINNRDTVSLRCEPIPQISKNSDITPWPEQNWIWNKPNQPSKTCNEFTSSFNHPFKSRPEKQDPSLIGDNSSGSTKLIDCFDFPPVYVLNPSKEESDATKSNPGKSSPVYVILSSDEESSHPVSNSEELGMFDSQRETDGKMKMEQTSDRNPRPEDWVKSKFSGRDRFCTTLVTNQDSSKFPLHGRSRSSDRISLSSNQDVHYRRRSRSPSRSSQSSNRDMYHRKRSRSPSRCSQSSRHGAHSLRRSRSPSTSSKSSRQGARDPRRSRSPTSRSSQSSKQERRRSRSSDKSVSRSILNKKNRSRSPSKFRRRSRSSDKKCPNGFIQNKRKNKGFSHTIKDKFSAPLLRMKGVRKRSKSKNGRRSRSPRKDRYAGVGKKNASRARSNSISKQTIFEATAMRRSRSPARNSTSSFKFGRSPERSRSRFPDTSISPWKNPHNNQRLGTNLPEAMSIPPDITNPFDSRNNHQLSRLITNLPGAMSIPPDITNPFDSRNNHQNRFLDRMNSWQPTNESADNPWFQERVTEEGNRFNDQDRRSKNRDRSPIRSSNFREKRRRSRSSDRFRGAGNRNRTLERIGQGPKNGFRLLNKALGDLMSRIQEF